MPDRLSAWRTPLVILVCGCLIGLLGFGPRSTFGFFLGPMSNANGWGRDVFALALAIASAAHDRALPAGMIALGEVGLSGEIRRVGGTGRRLAEAARQGYTVALVPEDTGPPPPGMRLVEVPDLGSAFQRLF